MAFKRWDGAAFVDIAAIKRWDGAAWVDLAALKRWDGAAWVDITLPSGSGDLSAIVAPFRVSIRFQTSEPAASAALLTTTAPAVVTASGGTGPYTYSWTKLSGDSTIQCQSPTDASTYFYAYAYKNEGYTATWRCTITDAALDSVTADVNVSIRYFTNA